MERIILSLSGKVCTVWKHPEARAMAIQLTGDHEADSLEQEIEEINRRTAGIPFSFASIPIENWNQELSSNPKRPSGKDTKTRYYYYCKNTGTATGHKCHFRTNIEQSEIDNFVADVISAMVHNPQFEKAIKDKIGTVVDTTDMQKELEAYRQQLRQILTTKARLEKQMDSLDVTDPHYDRKIIDLQRRYDAQYDIMGEVEGHIDELEEQILAIQEEQISGDNVYQLLLAFDELYAELEDIEKRDVLRAIVERVDLYPEKRSDGCWVRNIVFNFPVPVGGVDLKELPLENATTLETVVLMSKVK